VAPEEDGEATENWLGGDEVEVAVLVEVEERERPR
jgi:hypothetical protein